LVPGQPVPIQIVLRNTAQDHDPVTVHRVSLELDGTRSRAGTVLPAVVAWPRPLAFTLTLDVLDCRAARTSDRPLLSVVAALESSTSPGDNTPQLIPVQLRSDFSRSLRAAVDKVCVGH
jgi:hypothetical protein